MPGSLPVPLGSPFISEHDLDNIIETGVAVIDSGAEPDEAVDAALQMREHSSAWHVATLSQAQWAMSKLHEARSRMDEITATAREMERQVAQWRDAQLHRLQLTESFFAHHLTAYLAEQRMASKGQIKSLPLVGGTVKSTAHRPKLVVTDEQAVIAWAKEHGGACQEDVVRVKESVSKSGLAEWASVVDVLVGWLLLCVSGAEHFIENPDVTQDGEPPYTTGEIIEVNGETEAVRDVQEVRELRVVALWDVKQTVPGVTVEEAHVSYRVETEAVL